LTPGSANDSFLKVGNYDVKGVKTPPPQKKINATLLSTDSSGHLLPGLQRPIKLERF